MNCVGPGCFSADDTSHIAVSAQLGRMDEYVRMLCEVGVKCESDDNRGRHNTHDPGGSRDSCVCAYNQSHMNCIGFSGMQLIIVQIDRVKVINIDQQMRYIFF